MRLATMRTEDRETLAAIVESDSVEPIREAGGNPYEDLGAVLRDGAGGRAAIAAAAARGGVEPLREERLLRPVLDPGGVICVGHNYRAHIAEMGREVPSYPTLFGKLSRALTDPYAEVALPPASTKVDYEAELAVVIGAGGRDIPREQAWEAVAGLTILNDVSMRDYQLRTIQWFAGKNFERATPVGPILLATEGAPDLERARMRLAVNGETRQETDLGDLLFDVPALVEYISTVFELRPGDMIATGTPGGVGHAMDPPCYLADRDVVEVQVDGIGRLRNTFVAGA